MNDLIRAYDAVSDTPGVDSELYMLTQKKKNISFSNSQFSEIKEALNSGFSIRVIEGKRKGFVSSSRDNVDEAFRTARTLAGYSSETEMKFHGDVRIVRNNDFLSRYMDLNEKYFIDQGKWIIDQIQSKITPDKAGINVDFNLKSDDLHILNSRGLDKSFLGQSLSVHCSINTALGDNVIEVSSSESARNRDINYEQMIRRLIQDYQLSRITVPFSSGTYPVVFSPSSMIWLLKALAQGLDGKNMHRKISPLTGKLHDQVLNSSFSLRETPGMIENPGSIPFDDEGTATRDRYFIEKGEFKNLLLNLESSALLGHEPGGNGYRFSLMSGRNYNLLPGTTFGPLQLDPGQTALADILSEIHEGVFLRLSYDCWMGNILNGDIKGSLSQAYRIRNGKLEGRIKNMSFAGNFYNLFGKQLVCASDQAETSILDSSFSSPHFLVKDVSIV